MKKMYQLLMTMALSCLLPAIAFADSGALHIDIPVKLEKAKVVFNMDHPAFSGDMPIGLRYMNLLSDRFVEQKIDGKIVAVFHGEAGYMLLNDQTYNTVRKVKTGNPYKEIVAELIVKKVQIEICAVTMKGNKWTNSDILPNVKVNAGAIIRLIQLNQEGYSEIHP